MCYCDDVIKFDNFDFDIILIDEKSFALWYFVQNIDWSKTIS